MWRTRSRRRRRKRRIRNKKLRGFKATVAPSVLK
jgi:hypothetical protein